MEPENGARRDFLLKMGGIAGTAWMSAQWPAMLAAAQHAHEAVTSRHAATFEVFTAEQAMEVEALASRIIPTDDLPGAREAGVVYFIDRALKTFASDTRPIYEKGLADLNKLTSRLFPGVERFSSATAEQQDKLVSRLSDESMQDSGPARRLQGNTGPDFFQTLWSHTVAGFLIDPEGGAGNRDYAGWKVIGREPDHSFSPPFGFYDKGYIGWQPNSAETEKQ